MRISRFLQQRQHRHDPARRVADILAGVDVRAFYEAEQGITIRAAAGWVQGGLCPFHENTTPGPFRFHLDSGAFFCHTCGAKGGDVIDFIRRRDGLSFGEALDYLTREHL